MRTLISCLVTTAPLMPVIEKLTQQHKLELVYVLGEDYQPDNPKHISTYPFIGFEYNTATQALIKHYIQDFPFDENIYQKLYPNLRRYLCNIGRHDKNFQYTSETDYLHAFNLIYHFLYALLVKEKIELVIFNHTPHVGWDDILADLCDVLRVKTLFLMSCCSPISNQPFLQYTCDKKEAVTFQHLSKKYRKVSESLNTSFTFHHDYMRSTSLFATLKEYFASMIYRRGLWAGLRYSLWRLTTGSIRKFPLYCQFQYNRWMYTQRPNFEEKFVYFPLHLQPEITTSVNGGIYCDQLLAIERLSRLLPEDWYIYVKENPKQNEYMRGQLFFKRLHLVPRVKYISGQIPSAKLLRCCQFCACINGTAAFESICGGKPALIFGRVWWDFLPGVFKYHKGLNIHDILNYKIDLDKLRKQYNDYLNRTVYASTYPARKYQFSCPEFTDEISQRNLLQLLTDVLEHIKTTS